MKKLISLIFIVAIAVIGCSTITPAPEIAIVRVDPPGGITTTTGITITFVNKNKIDAIITNESILFQDTLGASETNSYPISQYVSASDSIAFKTDFSSLPLLGGAGAGRTMTLTFTGTDAYGYNKTFTVHTEKICY